MAQSSFFSHTIEHEAMKVWANAHPQNSLSGKDIVLKTTQQLPANYIKPFLGVEISGAIIFLSTSSLPCIACPVNLISL